MILYSWLLQIVGFICLSLLHCCIHWINLWICSLLWTTSTTFLLTNSCKNIPLHISTYGYLATTHLVLYFGQTAEFLPAVGNRWLTHQRPGKTSSANSMNLVMDRSTRRSWWKANPSAWGTCPMIAGVIPTIHYFLHGSPLQRIATYLYVTLCVCSAWNVCIVM